MRDGFGWITECTGANIGYKLASPVPYPFQMERRWYYDTDQVLVSLLFSFAFSFETSNVASRFLRLVAAQEDLRQSEMADARAMMPKMATTTIRKQRWPPLRTLIPCLLLSQSVLLPIWYINTWELFSFWSILIWLDWVTFHLSSLLEKAIHEVFLINNSDEM